MVFGLSLLNAEKEVSYMKYNKVPQLTLIFQKETNMFNEIINYFTADRKVIDEARDLLVELRAEQEAADALMAKLEARVLVMKTINCKQS